MGIFLKCEEANHNCDKAQYKEITFWENVKLQIHLIMCNACRKYTANNNKLSKTIKNAKLVGLPKEQKEKMKELIQKEISK